MLTADDDELAPMPTLASRESGVASGEPSAASPPLERSDLTAVLAELLAWASAPHATLGWRGKLWSWTGIALRPSREERELRRTIGTLYTSLTTEQETP